MKWLIPILALGLSSVGLAERSAWTTSRVAGTPDPPKPLVVERVFPKLRFAKPVDLIYEATTNRYFAVELNGRILSFANESDVATSELVIDLKKLHPKMRRVYSLVFHPKFKENRFVYVCYIAENNTPDGTRIARFKMTDSNPPRIDETSEQVLLTWRSGGHNGCRLLFGPDGKLYISTGDASNPSPPDPLKTGQDISDLLSSVLRIDVDRCDGDRKYGIPKDNPFVDHPGARPEVWAYGLRNPWRMSFDSKTGDLWVGDVGWELWELIFRVERGGNYGWSIVEGSQSVNPNATRGPTPIQPPIVQHPHTEAMSITGGYVYRGDRLKALRGQYVYGDYITGKLWSIPATRQQDVKPTAIADSSVKIIAFAETPKRDVLVLDYEGGIYRLVANPQVNQSAAFPKKLSETGLFASVKKHQLASGVVGYGIHAPLWSDHAKATRFIAMPGDGKIGKFDKNDAYKGWYRGKWSYPQGTVFGKTYAMEMKRGEPASRQRLETQILHLDGDQWRGYTYVWNAKQIDATLASSDGMNQSLSVKDASAANGVRQQTWHVASRTECMTCHNAKSGIILGFRPEQMHATSGASELSRLERMGLFEAVKSDTPPVVIQPMASPYDEGGELNKRARSWLHVNCAHCHQHGGGGSTVIDLRFSSPLERTKLTTTLPTQGEFGIKDAKLVAPGDPFGSVLLYRIATTGAGHMPHIGSKMTDERAMRLMHDWIAGPGDKSHVIGAAHLTASQIGTHLESTRGALWLRHAVASDAVSKPVRGQITELGASHADVRISGLFQQLVPAEQRRRTLGQSVKPSDVLSLKGDPVRGARIMKQGAAVTCLSCHRVGEQGRALGPELTAIGSKFKRDELLAHILEPSKVIDDQFATWLISTLDGDDFTGFVTERGKASLKVKLLTGVVATFKRADIDSMRKLKLSSMPTHLLQGITAQEAADLVDYLSSLKN